MTSLSARVDIEWKSFTPLHEHTLDRAREILRGTDGPYAGAIVGVYGSGKSALTFALLREAAAEGAVVVWDEAAPVIERVVAADERVLPQTFAARVRAWVDALRTSPTALAAYESDLGARGHAEIAGAVRASVKGGGARTVLILDEVEQTHELLRRRIVADDGQPLRALIDSAGPAFRLFLAYAPESYHSAGDADRGRLAYLPVPALDVASIQSSFGLGRGEANFAWWASRGRARGVLQVASSVLAPYRRGAFDRGLDDLGDALDALPGVFGVPAILRDGLSHAALRALLDLRPQPSTAGERGIVCELRDRTELADRFHDELGRRVATTIDLRPAANELVAILSAVAGEDDRAYLTMDDFRAAVRLAEARAIESGRQTEPVDRLADQALLAFSSLGEMGILAKRAPASMMTLAEGLFPSPFTDPYLPLEGGRVPAAADLDRRFRELAAKSRGPLLVSAERDFVVFADEGALERFVAAGALDGSSDPLRVVLLGGIAARSPLVELAVAAGKVCVTQVGPFHATFLQCLAVRGAARGELPSVEALSGDAANERQVARKIAWHLDRISLLLRDVKARLGPLFAAARSFVREERFRAALSKLKGDSPALLALLLPLRPPPPAERRLLVRLAKLLDAKEPLRKIARLVNPGGRLSGAAVVVDELLPSSPDTVPWTERNLPEAAQLADLLDAHGQDAERRARLARWLLPEDHVRLASLFAFFAGALPDISEEQAQLEALQGLERTVRRAETIVADLEVGTGRSRERLRSLKLGIVTDHVRGSGGPVAQLRSLGEELRTSESPPHAVWSRSLGLWICGVFADRLLTGVEKEQSELSEWELVAAAARDVGARASRLEGSFAELSADACLALVRDGRRRLANHLDGRASLERELRTFRELVAGLEPLANTLGVADTALRERGIQAAAAVAAYLPDEDALRSHQSLLRRVPELLDEIEGACPSPGGRGLIDYLELLRRHAEGTRRERLRIRLEVLLDIIVPADLRLDHEAVEAIEQRWKALSPALREGLQRALRGLPVQHVEELERWISQADEKALLVESWRELPLPALRALDESASAWSRKLGTTAEQVRETSRQRARAAAAVTALPASLRPSITAALVAEAAMAEAGHAHAHLAEIAESLGEEVFALLTELKASGIALPLVLPADAAAELLKVLHDRVATAHEARAHTLSEARATGSLLARWGESAANIPAELNLAQAARLSAHERERLRSLLEDRSTQLLAWLRGQGLPELLCPARQPRTESLATWSQALETAYAGRLRLEPCLSALGRLGVVARTLDDTAAGDGICAFDHVERALLEQLHRTESERQVLGLRYEEAAARLQRLGGELPPLASGAGAFPTLTLAAAEATVQRLEQAIEARRRVALQACSPEARSAYRAIRSGIETGLPPALAELVRLGLVRAAEDAP